MNKRSHQLSMVLCLCSVGSGHAQAPQPRPDGSHPVSTNCQDLSRLDIVLPSGDTSTWYKDPFARFGSNLLFLCEGQPVSGPVALMPGPGTPPVHGMLKDGRPHGIWSFGDSAEKFLFWRYEFNHGIDTIHWFEYEYYYSGRRNSKWSRISDSLAIDSVWRMPPYGIGLAAVGWRDLTSSKAPLWGDQFKYLRFDSTGLLSEYYKKDSIDIEWSDDEEDLANKVRYCRCQEKGLCVGILRGRPWKLVEYGGPRGSKVEYWSSDQEGTPYPRGVFKHFGSNGEVHSIFVPVERSHYLRKQR